MVYINNQSLLDVCDVVVGFVIVSELSVFKLLDSVFLDDDLSGCSSGCKFWTATKNHIKHFEFQSFQN